MVKAADRSAPVLLAIVSVTDPDPAPLVFDRVIHEGTPLEVQLQLLAVALIWTTAVDPDAGKLDCDVVTVKPQADAAAAWVRTTVAPAIVSTASRAAGAVLAAMVKLTVCVPLPETSDKVSHVGAPLIVQAQPG